MKYYLCLCFLVVTLAAAAQANRYDIVIEEIMSDPSPQVQLSGGLPEAEFIELKNTSLKTVNLNGWKLSTGSSTATINSNFMLLPDSFVVISSTNAASLLAPFGRTLGIS